MKRNEACLMASPGKDSWVCFQTVTFRLLVLTAIKCPAGKMVYTSCWCVVSKFYLFMQNPLIFHLYCVVL